MVFPIHSFLSPTSPFPTRWLPRLVRHFSRGTMRMLRLPAAPPVALRFSSNNGYLLASISFRSPRAPGVAPAAPGRWSTGLATCSGSFSRRKPVGSLKFPGYPFVLLPCSQTPVGSPRQAFCGASILPPRCRLRRLQHQVIISRLNHTALAPAPYASCRHRCRLRNVRFRLVASLCRVVFFTHWVPVLCFRVLFSIRLHALPHILGLLDATATPDF